MKFCIIGFGRDRTYRRLERARSAVAETAAGQCGNLVRFFPRVSVPVRRNMFVLSRLLPMVHAAAVVRGVTRYPPQFLLAN